MAEFFTHLDEFLSYFDRSTLFWVAMVCTPLGLVFLQAGNNMMDRGRGGKLTEQGAIYIGLGAMALVVGSAILVYLATGLPSEHCLLIGFGTMFSGYLAKSQIQKRAKKRRSMQQKIQAMEAQQRYQSWHQFVAEVDPKQFERFCAWIFFKSGYAVRHTGKSGDEGIDIELKKDGLFQVAQCKRYTDRAVSSPEVRDFYGAMVGARADHGHIMTTSKYTRDARKWVKGKAITLWDRDELEPWVQRWSGDRFDQPMEPVKECRYCGAGNRLEAHFCSKCGAPLA